MLQNVKLLVLSCAEALWLIEGSLASGISSNLIASIGQKGLLT